MNEAAESQDRRLSLDRAMLKHLSDEYHAEELAWREVLGKAPDKLIEEGLMIRARVSENQGRSAFVEPERHDFKAKEGDRLQVFTDTDGEPRPFRQLHRITNADVEGIDLAGRLSLELWKSNALQPGASILLGPSDPVWDFWLHQSSILKSAGASPLYPHILNPAPERRHIDWNTALADLTEPQEGARFLQGPPGTGKTRLIAAMAMRRAARGEAILVTAFTHRALDAVADAIIDLGKSEKNPIRPEKYSASRNAICRVECDTVDNIDPRAGRIVLATTHAVLKHIAKEGRTPACSLLVIDEASQLTLPALFALTWNSPRVLLVGDPCQLGPVSKTDEPRSVVDGFHTLFECAPFTVLKESFRLNGELAGRIGGWFYDGRLCSSAQPVESILPPGIELLDPSADAAPGETPGMVEAKAIRRKIEEIRSAHPVDAKASRHHPDIVVSCLYRQQVSRVRECLGSLAAGVRIDSVERNQGQTAAIAAFLSFGKSGPELAADDLSWTFDYRRINVALSRARHVAYIVASPEILQLAASEKNPDATSRAAFAEFLPPADTAKPQAPQPVRHAGIMDILAAPVSATAAARTMTWRDQQLRVPSPDEPLDGLDEEGRKAAGRLAQALAQSSASGLSPLLTYGQLAEVLGCEKTATFSVLKQLQRYAVMNGCFDFSALVVGGPEQEPGKNHYRGHTRNAEEWREYVRLAREAVAMGRGE